MVQRGDRDRSGNPASATPRHRRAVAGVAGAAARLRTGGPEFMEGDRTTRSVAENTPAGANIGEPVAASDFNRDTLTYSLRGLGSDLFDLDASSGQLLTKDGPGLRDRVELHRLRVGPGQQERHRQTRHSSGTPSSGLPLAVTNEDEAGAVALSLSEPDVDIPITASLTDPDGGLDRVVWSWARSTDQTAWTAIRGAALASYTPVAADKGSYLRATASYTDGHKGRARARGRRRPPPSRRTPRQ